MLVKILGSAAGGGFPQWNCDCANCRRLRHGTLHARARTQTQVAFSPDSRVWFLLGASPDLRSQILAAPELAPRSEEGGHSPIGGVFLTSADLDSVMGLLHLREFSPFFVFSTAAVARILRKENGVFRVLDRADPAVQWQTLAGSGRLGCHLSVEGQASPSFICSTIPLGSGYPDYVSAELARTLPRDEAGLGITIEEAGKRLFFAPSLPGLESEWIKRAAASDVALLDGTFWSDDELAATGRTARTAREMGHLPLGGPEGLLAGYPRDTAGRRILVHINNTNPILDEDSPEHRAVVDAGFEMAYDGMEIQL